MDPPRFHVITATVLPARDQKRPHLSGTLPAHNADHITRSVLVIQALDNTWSLPNRRRRSSRYFDSAIRDGTVLSHEGHGLRRADNITHALEAELVFRRTGLTQFDSSLSLRCYHTLYETAHQPDR